jgi:Ca2+/Na+ antiporter
MRFIGMRKIHIIMFIRISFFFVFHLFCFVSLFCLFVRLFFFCFYFFLLCFVLFCLCFYFKLLTYHRIANRSYTTSAICRLGTAYPLIASEITADCWWGSCCEIFTFSAVFCGLCDRMIVGFTTKYASVPITINVVRSNPAHGEVYSMQHYVINFVSDLRQVCGFPRGILFPPPIKLTATI